MDFELFITYSILLIVMMTLGSGSGDDFYLIDE